MAGPHGASPRGHWLESRLFGPCPSLWSCLWSCLAAVSCGLSLAAFPLRRASPRRATVVVLLAAAATAAGATGCGSDQSNGGSVKGDTLTIFSSLPLQGPES